MKLKRFSLLREQIALKIDLVQRHLEECLAVKSSYEKFAYIDLDAVEITSYALCVILSVINAVEGKWDMEFTMFKVEFL